MSSVTPKPHVRWMIRRDMPRVLEIEKASFEKPFYWSEEEFVRHIRCRNIIGMIVEVDNLLLGYMVYELNRSHLFLCKFSVDPEFRRRGLGTTLIEKLISKLRPMHRNRIVLSVNEANLDAQLFFREAGFKAKRVLPNYYAHADQDAYDFELNIKIPEAVS